MRRQRLGIGYHIERVVTAGAAVAAAVAGVEYEEMGGQYNDRYDHHGEASPWFWLQYRAGNSRRGSGGGGGGGGRGELRPVACDPER